MGDVAFQQLEPRFFVRGLGSCGPIFLKHISLAQLLGNFAPKEVGGTVPAIEGSHPGRIKGKRIHVAAQIVFPEALVFCQQSETDEEVGFTTTHGLLQVENGLGGNPGQPGQVFGHEVLHPLSDEGFLEIGGPVSLGMDQFIKLLNSIGQFDREALGWRTQAKRTCFRRMREATANAGEGRSVGEKEKGDRNAHQISFGVWIWAALWRWNSKFFGASAVTHAKSGRGMAEVAFFREGVFRCNSLVISGTPLRT